MADSKVAGSGFGFDLACSLGSMMLKKALGKTKMNIWDIGPATFNREQDDTSVTHILTLFEKIMLHHGFATYRYDVMWAHKPSLLGQSHKRPTSSVENRDIAADSGMHRALMLNR